MSTLWKTKVLPHLARRVLAIDLGSSHLKLILAEETFGRIRIVHHRLIDLQQEGLLSLEEINRHLQELVLELGEYPVALAIPQHLAWSYVVDLPRVGRREVRQLIELETLNLSGLSEAAILYDYFKLKPFGRHANPFWLTIAREQEIQNQIHRLAPEDTECSFSEITTPANALIAACLARQPDSQQLVLVDIGATCTVVAVIDHGQAVYSANFPIGSESFTGAITSLKKCGFEEAESIKRTQDLFEGPNHLAGFLAVVDIWHQDLEKLLREWLEDNTELRARSQNLRVRLSGGGAEQPGLLGYLQAKGVFQFETWPEETAHSGPVSMTRFAVALGLASQSFRGDYLYTSLLPPSLKVIRQRHRQLMRANLVGFCLLFLLLLLLVVGSARLWVLTQYRKAAAADADAAYRKSQSIELLLQQREAEYATVLPMLDRQKRTTDALKILQLLQQTRIHRDLSYVLFADTESYYAGGPVRFAETNVSSVPAGTPFAGRAEMSADFIAELTIPDKAGDKQKVLRNLLDEFKIQPLFRKVDALPASQRTNLFDPKVLPPDQVFALSMSLAEHELPRPNLRPAKTPKTTPGSKTR